MSYSVTRDLISNNFKGVHLKTQSSFDKQDINDRIDLWKYLLTYKCHAVKGESVLIGIMDLGLDYIALCFAAAELSLKIVVVDYSRPDDFVDIDFYDSKTKLLSPIDIFLHDVPALVLEQFKEDCGKHNFFNSCSRRSYNIYEDIDYTITSTSNFEIAKRIKPNPSDILMRCTSSGTTNTPKIVEHTHEFLSSITYRNSSKFFGKCLHIKNLNHGSSLAVYLLPTLLSDDTTEHLFYNIDNDDDFDKLVALLEQYANSLEYAIFPYAFLIDQFIQATTTAWPKLNVQTLSYIQETVKDAIKEGKIKSITSIFGSNETSGPVFENVIDKNNLNQHSSNFTKLDNFFDIVLDKDGLLNVGMPFYNTNIITNDVFEQQGDVFVHKGRSDLVKINGEIVDIKIINELNTSYTNAYLVTDSVHNCLYLAFWEQESVEILDSINKQLEKRFKRVKVTKTKVLNKSVFLTGIKLDNEMIREYFRNYV